MRSRSPQNLKCGHFTLLFCRGRQRNVLKWKTKVQSDCFCSLNLLFCGVVVAVAVVVAKRNSVTAEHARWHTWFMSPRVFIGPPFWIWFVDSFSANIPSNTRWSRSYFALLELVWFFRAIHLCVCVVFLVMDAEVSRESSTETVHVVSFFAKFHRLKVGNLFSLLWIYWNQRHLQFIGK